ncbi:methionine adenosyltransferase [Corynebacterium auris]|uniref:methionine adenosyltransferase n=1 Tax=Corynebacterium auris TaxID=44750 RepID=UPI0025B57BBE|nr:methionine adenosyltransferase [Corynebacterium auris]WJY68114.1 S-adenosylmethionine synthase [Corynebacterium auris]
MTLRLFTSEAVTDGRPDKICDQISDNILDTLITQDAHSRTAVETLVTTGLVHVAREIRTSGYADIAAIARRVINGIGYTSSEMGFDGDPCGVTVSIGEQSPEIGDGVSSSEESRNGTASPLHDQQGAGDHGLMFGYATNETPELMPLAIRTAHRLAERLTTAPKSGQLPFRRPDGKTQVTLGYDRATPRAVDTVVVSTQHHPDMTQDQLRDALDDAVIRPVVEETGLDLSGMKLLVNPSGSFVMGDPKADAGLTGRKIIIDTYGGAARHGGGAFSGKDPSKVDRSAAYAMRWVAKNIVAADLAERAEVQVAYAIGKANPVGLYVEMFGTGTVEDQAIARAVREVFDLRPGAIIRDLELLRPIYAQTAAYGHFGRELPEFTWERTDRADDLRIAVL